MERRVRRGKVRAHDYKQLSFGVRGGKGGGEGGACALSPPSLSQLLHTLWPLASSCTPALTCTLLRAHLHSPLHSSLHTSSHLCTHFCPPRLPGLRAATTRRARALPVRGRGRRVRAQGNTRRAGRRPRRPGTAPDGPARAQGEGAFCHVLSVVSTWLQRLYGSLYHDHATAIGRL